MAGHGTTEHQPAVEAAILDRLLKMEDTVGDIRTLLEAHVRAAHQRHQTLLAAIEGTEQAQKYYGEELIKAYHRLERLYHRLDAQLLNRDALYLPESPAH